MLISMNNRTEKIFFKLLCCYLIIYFASVDCWKFEKTNYDTDRSWAQSLEGQDICDYKHYSHKKRYFVCKQASQGKIEGDRIMFPKDSLGKAEEMKEEKYKCTLKTVYYDVTFQDGSFLTSEKNLFTCPTTDEEGKKYFYGRGKNKNEIGIYKKKKLKGFMVYEFIGAMKGIDLSHFGNVFMSTLTKIPILKYLTW